MVTNLLLKLVTIGNREVSAILYPYITQYNHGRSVYYRTDRTWPLCAYRVLFPFYTPFNQWPHSTQPDHPVDGPDCIYTADFASATLPTMTTGESDAGSQFVEGTTVWTTTRPTPHRGQQLQSPANCTIFNGTVPHFDPCTVCALQDGRCTVFFQQ